VAGHATHDLSVVGAAATPGARDALSEELDQTYRAVIERLPGNPAVSLPS
jgi:hypothetical protein